MTTIIDGQAGITFNDASVQGTAGYTGFRNRIINGDMRIDQRNAGASVTPTSTGVRNYITDRWGIYISQASKLSAQQNAGSVTPPSGYTNYLGMTSLSAYSPVSSDLILLQQPIEGYNISDLAWGTGLAKTVTISFWAYSNLPGNYSGAIVNNAASRSYPFLYTISAANTWQYFTVVIPGDTGGAGAWLTTNGVGLYVNFNLGTGSTYQGTAGAWTSGSYWSAVGAVNTVATSGATLYITGFQFEVGGVATPFERRNFGVEFGMCQRYYFQIGGVSAQPLPTGQASSGTQAYIPILFPVTLRTAPSGSNFSVSANSDWYMVNAAVNTSLAWTASTITNADVQTALLQITVASGLVAGNASFAQAANTSARIKFSAEL